MRNRTKKMSENKPFDTALARNWCMNWGTVVGVLTCLSFLCSMYGLQTTPLGLLSNALGLVAIWIAARGIRMYRRQVGEVSFMRACWLALMTYLFAILLTAAVQFVYFQFFDHGQLAMQVRQLFDMPEYRQWLSQMATGEDLSFIEDTMLGLFASPARATMQMMWMNSIVALLLLLPTALLGMAGTADNKSQT